MTLTIAIYAAVVSTCSLIVALLAFRAGGPEVKVVPTVFERQHEVAEVKVINRGRGPVTIVNSTFVVRSPEIPMLLEKPDSGPGMPYRLDGHDGVTWGFAIHEENGALAGMIIQDIDSGDELEAFFLIELGDGRTLSGSVEPEWRRSAVVKWVRRFAD